MLNPNDILLDYYNSKVPPKEILFPKIELLFEYRINGKDIEIKDRQDFDGKNVILGIRPCDAHALTLMANFFTFHGNCEDEIFIKKRENTILIGIGCNIPKSTCFCTSVGGHPFQKEDLDILLIDLGDKYLVEIISDEGKHFIQKLAWLSKAKKDDVHKAKILSKLAEDSFIDKFNFTDIGKTLNSNFNNPIWTEISNVCIGCGTCSFFCPTCTCFDVIDEKDQYNSRGRRIRIWDTCQFCIYTLHTSGHNPRNSCIERCRNRIMHKFSYYPQNYNLLGCVGCGRCIQLCPVNNDIRVIINKLKQIKKEEKEVIV